MVINEKIKAITSGKAEIVKANIMDVIKTKLSPLIAKATIPWGIIIIAEYNNSIKYKLITFAAIIVLFVIGREFSIS